MWRWANIDPFGSNKAQSIRGFEYNLRFAGQVYDKETGLHYNHFRDYNPKTGRYIQSDPIGLNGGINTYAYVGNNPLNFVDPLGLIRDSVSTYCRAHPKDCMAAGLLPVPALLNPPKIPPLPGFCSDLPNILNPDIPPYLPFPLNVVLPIIPHLPAFDGDKADNNAKGKPADGPSFPPYIESSNGGGGKPPPNLTPDGAGRRGAYREAKRQSGIPTSQQPSKTGPNIDNRNNTQPGRSYDFEVPKSGGGTETKNIRDDVAGHYWGENNPQNRGSHFNDEAKNHFDY